MVDWKKLNKIIVVNLLLITIVYLSINQMNKMDNLPEINGDINIVKQIIESSGDINKKYGYIKEPLIYHASGHGWLHIVKYLIKSGCDINARTGRGETSLHVAARHGHDQIIKYLIKHGCNPNLISISYETPLHIAACYSSVNVVKYLLAIPDINIDALDTDNGTALINAAMCGIIEIVKCLLDYGANKELVDIHGRTATGCYNSDVAEYIRSYEPVPTKGVYIDDEPVL